MESERLCGEGGQDWGEKRQAVPKDCVNALSARMDWRVGQGLCLILAG